MSALYVGMGPPYVVRVVVAASADFDPIVAAAAVSIALVVRRPVGGDPVEWPATIVASSSTSITVQHELGATDLDVRGIWPIWARFTLSDGSILRTVVGAMHVAGANEIRA